MQDRFSLVEQARTLVE